MVEFSPSMGSEIKGKHLAIVLTKNDSPNNGVLTVIPLSSKNKPYYVPIGNFFLNEAIPFLDKQLNEFIENIKNVTDEEKKEFKAFPVECISKVQLIMKDTEIIKMA